LIELLHGADDITLTLSIDPPGSANIQYWIALGAKLDALELSGQEAAVPLPRCDRLSLAKPAQRRQHDEARQTIRLGAEPVEQPRAHARTARDGGPRVHERMGRIVVDRLGLHRAEDTKVIRNRADVREDCADFLARLAELLERMLRREAGQFRPLQLG